jgi:hypothetical protein
MNKNRKKMEKMEGEFDYEAVARYTVNRVGEGKIRRMLSEKSKEDALTYLTECCKRWFNEEPYPGGDTPCDVERLYDEITGVLGMEKTREPLSGGQGAPVS